MYYILIIGNYIISKWNIKYQNRVVLKIEKKKNIYKSLVVCVQGKYKLIFNVKKLFIFIEKFTEISLSMKIHCFFKIMNKFNCSTQLQIFLGTIVKIPN